jgi:hypothetical protein
MRVALLITLVCFALSNESPSAIELDSDFEITVSTDSGDVTFEVDSVDYSTDDYFYTETVIVGNDDVDQGNAGDDVTYVIDEYKDDTQAFLSILGEANATGDFVYTEIYDQKVSNSSGTYEESDVELITGVYDGVADEVSYSTDDFVVYESYTGIATEDSDGNYEIEQESVTYGTIGDVSFEDYKEVENTVSADGTYGVGEADESFVWWVDTEVVEPSSSISFVSLALITALVAVVAFLAYKKSVQVKKVQNEKSVKAIDEESSGYIRI